MLQNRQDKRNIQLPRQDRPPSSKDVHYLLDLASSNANIGRTIELPFGSEPVNFLLTVRLPGVQEKAQWMFYKVDRSHSSLEWSQTTHDAIMISNAICAQFPEVQMGLESAKGMAMGAPPLIFQDRPKEVAQEAPGRGAQNGQARRPGKELMEGELKHLTAAQLLQSIQLGKMTGRLELKGDTETADIYFALGNPVHCAVRGSEGESPLLELVSMTRGSYKFYYEAPPSKRTIEKRLDELILDGQSLYDQYRWLEQKGIGPDTYLLRLHASITEQSFEQIVARGIPCRVSAQKNFYQAIDNYSSLLEILRRTALRKSEWVPALHNMLNCQLISVRDGPPPAPAVKEETVPATTIDWSQVRAAERNLYRPDSGLLLSPAFLGFLEREHQRAQILHKPYSLVVLELGSINDSTGDRVPLSVKGVKEVVQHIEQIKRKCDLIGHFETFSIGILLPETTGAAARNFATTLCDHLLARGLKEDGRRVVIKVGRGCVPEDCEQLESLLTVAHPG